MVSTKPYIIGPSKTYEGFDAHYKAAGQVGQSTVRYVLFNGQNPADTTYFDVVFTSSLTGVEEVIGGEPLSLNPNPASSFVKITFDPVSYSLATLRIINILGQTLSTSSLSGCDGSYRLDISDLSEGIYFVTLEAEKQNRLLRKLVIKR